MRHRFFPYPVTERGTIAGCTRSVPFALTPRRPHRVGSPFGPPCIPPSCVNRPGRGADAPPGASVSHHRRCTRKGELVNPEPSSSTSDAALGLVLAMNPGLVETQRDG
jgi:hypothetical protein